MPVKILSMLQNSAVSDTIAVTLLPPPQTALRKKADNKNGEDLLAAEDEPKVVTMTAN